MNILKSIHRSSPVSITLVAMVGLFATGQVPAAEPYSVTVKYYDLDLSTLAGARTLYGRISAAARNVCGYEGRSITDQAFWNGCSRRCRRQGGQPPAHRRAYRSPLGPVGRHAAEVS